MRNLLLALILLLGVYFVITRFTEAQQVALTLQRGNWLWLLAAAEGSEAAKAAPIPTVWEP